MLHNFNLCFYLAMTKKKAVVTITSVVFVVLSVENNNKLI